MYPHHNYASVFFSITFSLQINSSSLLFSTQGPLALSRARQKVLETEEIQLLQFVCTQAMRLQVCHVDARLNALPLTRDAFLSCNTQPLN